MEGGGGGGGGGGEGVHSMNRFIKSSYFTYDVINNFPPVIRKRAPETESKVYPHSDCIFQHQTPSLYILVCRLNRVLYTSFKPVTIST